MTSAKIRYALSLLIGLAVGAAVWLIVEPGLGVLAGIAAMALTFVVTGVAALWPMNAEETNRHADSEDVSPATQETLIVLAVLASAAAIVWLLISGGQDESAVAAPLGLLAVFLTWGMLHLMYTARYAHLYYSVGDGGGIDFNMKQDPCFKDFFYFSYNLGMTYQVSDTDVSRTELRAVVLRHCLLSYVVGAVILASAINLVAGAIGGQG